MAAAQGPITLSDPIPQVDKSPIDIKVGEVAQADALPFDPAALKQKYLAERDKRLARGEGNEQYIRLEGSLAHFLKDPWVEPGFTRAPITSEVDVVVVGGGYGGQVVAVNLVKAGITNFTIIEKASDFGGTWYWSRYPGARCDIESYIYLPLLEETNFMPTEKYSRADEMLAHARSIGEKFNLYERALFQTETTSMTWREQDAKWITKTSRGDTITSRFVIPAAGPLHRPKLLGVPGIEDFKGHAFHSSRWDYAYTGGDCKGGLEKLKNKRVGIIGTGATAVQIVPQLGEWAQKLYVFQRTPSSVDVRGNRPTDAAWAAGLKPGWQFQRMENFNNLVSGLYEEEDMVSDRWTDIIRSLLVAGYDPKNPVEAAAKRQVADFKKMEEIRARVDEVVKDKETAEALKPWYNQFCKRPCFHDEYLETFNRENVTLVDTKGKGVERITEKGVVANGEEYELDCLIYATGFETANSWTEKCGIEIYGRDGLTISEKWKHGASTLHGWASRGFPNCLWVSIVQAVLAPNFMHVTAEQAKHFAYVIAECKKRGIRALEPTQEAEDGWVEEIVKGAELRKDFFKECTPGYYNNEGKMSEEGAKNGFWAGGCPAFIKLLADWREKGALEGMDITFET
jgi:cyclohexanone monooxygenase